MKLEVVQRAVQGIPYIAPTQGRRLYEFLLAQRPAEVLELGFAHGASSCYVAAALDELGRGRLTCVDRKSSVDRVPNLETLLVRTDLERFVTIHREPNTYDWFLKRKIEEQTRNGTCEPIYDFCYIDGSKNWTVDGCAFFLVDKLLRPGGWILFDDYKWTYKRYQETTGNVATDGLTHRTMAAEFRVEDDSSAFAHKVRSERRTLTFDTIVSLRTRALWIGRKVAKRVLARGAAPR